MALGTIDFTKATGFVVVPAGTYDGQTKGWQAKPTNAGDSMNVEATFDFEGPDGAIHPYMHRWNLKPRALWRIKRDLLAMGADPADLEGTNVDLEGVLNGLCGGVPTPVRLTFSVVPYTPEGADKPRDQNELVKVALREQQIPF